MILRFKKNQLIAKGKKKLRIKTSKLAHLYHFHLIGYNRILNISLGKIEIGLERWFVSHFLHVIIFTLNECANGRQQHVRFSQLTEPCTPGTSNGIYCGVIRFIHHILKTIKIVQHTL